MPTIPADECVTLERRSWQALSTSGEAARAFFEEALDEHVVMLLPGGLVLDDRAAIIDSMAGTPWSRFALEDVRSFRVTPDCAVVTYKATAEREAQAYAALMSSMYARRADGWKLCLHQQTPV